MVDRGHIYEAKLAHARKVSLEEMRVDDAELGANAVGGVDLDYEVIREGMLMVTDSGTAVVVK